MKELLCIGGPYDGRCVTIEDGCLTIVAKDVLPFFTYRLHAFICEGGKNREYLAPENGPLELVIDRLFERYTRSPIEPLG